MEGDAGAEPLNPTDTTGIAGSAAAPETTADHAQRHDGSVPVSGSAPPSRLRGPALAGVALGLVILSVALTAGGVLAWRAHRANVTVVNSIAQALTVAEECVAATQAPNIDALSDAQQKILECATGQFQAQAVLNAPQLAMLYQAADVRVRISEMRSAVERVNPDDSLEVLLAFRTEIDNIETKGKEVGYRLRLKMVEDNGEYKVAELDQVGG